VESGWEECGLRLSFCVGAEIWQELSSVTVKFFSYLICFIIIIVILSSIRSSGPFGLNPQLDFAKTLLRLLTIVVLSMRSAEVMLQ
jgi:hypothetical protein